MFKTIRTFVVGGREHVLYECRNCGATVEAQGDPCPDCGRDEIAQFQF